MRSALGPMLTRAELFGTGSDGKPIKRADSTHLMHVRETKPHALSHCHGLDEAEQSRIEQAEFQRRVEALNPRERAVHDLQQASEWRIRKGVFTTAEMEAMRDDPNTIACERLKGDAWDVTRRYEHRLDQSAIAERLGLTPRQVRTVIQSKNRKLRSAG
jgi:hypothetical protein